MQVGCTETAADMWEYGNDLAKLVFCILVLRCSAAARRNHLKPSGHLHNENAL